MAVDIREALRKLTSGETLSLEEKQALNLAPTPTVDPLKNKTIKPAAPTGYHYTWIGGTNTGSWVLYKDSVNPTNPNPPAPGGGNDTLDVNPTLAVTKAYMINMGYPADLIDSSTEFLKSLLIDGINSSNAIDILLNNKSYTTKNGKTLTSPFYEAYGVYNEGLAVPKSMSEIFNAVEGFKAVVKKYNLSPKFASKEQIAKLIKNNWDTASYDNAANTARLLAITSDPYQIEAMKRMGFINQAQDLTDFYMNADIGKEKMQQNIATAAFGAEFLRRITPENLMTFNADFLTKAGAYAASQGLDASGATSAAITAAENISQNLYPTYKLTGIYEPGSTAKPKDIQSELEQEQLTGGGTASSKRAKLKAMEIGGWSGSAGMSGTSAYLRKSSLGGSSQPGSL